MEQEGPRYSVFNVFDLQDKNLLCSIARGEFNISGLQNKTLRRYPPQRSSSHKWSNGYNPKLTPRSRSITSFSSRKTLEYQYRSTKETKKEGPAFLCGSLVHEW
jgi:hypothetical protein